MTDTQTTQTSSVARVIADQIGGPTLYLIGAKDLTARDDSLTFRVGRGARGEGGAVTHVRITLEPTDTYTVESLRVNVRAKEMIKTLESVSPVYFDQLHAAITKITGMATSL